MSVPNHQSIVDRVYAAGSYDLRTRVGCGTLVEAACIELHRADPKWGHLKKNLSGTHYNGHSHDGCLYLSDAPGQSVHVDFIANAESHEPDKVPSITWNPDIPRYSKSDWYAPEMTPAPGPSHSCLLGCSLFWGMVGIRSHRAKLEQNLTWIRDTLGGDYVRTFAVLGGDIHGGVDPWINAGSWLSWPDWATLLGQYTDLCFDKFGLRVEWTLFGSRGQTQALNDCERVVDAWLAMAKTRLQKIALVEVWNEYNVNGASSSDLRHLARRLRAGLPADFPIALSSPGAVHACASASVIHAEVEKLYGGLPQANAITPHWCRANHVPPDLGPLAPAILINNEPRGPGASAGGDCDDPALLSADYRAAIAKRYRGNNYHPLGGIWGGMCHPNFPQENRWPDVFSSPNANATAAQLKAIREGGTAPPIDPIDPGEPEVPLPPYDEGWLADVVRPAVIARYQQAGHPLDDRYPIWLTRTLYDHNAGMTKDASLQKHLEELEDALGL